MTIITQNGLITLTSPWWFSMKISEDKKKLVLENQEEDTSLVIAKYKTQKQIVELYKSINFALNDGATSFNIKNWELEYSSTQ